MNITTIELTDWLAGQSGDFAASLTAYYRRNGRLTPAQEAAARRMHDRAMTARADRKAEIAVEAPTEIGFYLHEGLIYRTKKAQAGHLYMMVRTPNGWEFARGAIRVVPASAKITPEQASQHGLTTGICIFCDAVLDDADGLGKIVGVGPVCARKYLGLTQRQLAARIGANAAPEAPVAVSAVDRLHAARVAVVQARRAGRSLTAAELAEVDAMCEMYGPEGFYMDGEIYELIG
jgi:hypothetical protein